MSGYIPYMDDNQGRGSSEPIREDNREYPRSYSGTHSREGRYGYDQDKHVRRMSSRFNKEFKKRRHYDKKHEEYTSDTPHDCIRVEMCEFYPLENAQEHNTHMYEIVYNEPNRPVYRRGLTFRMTISFKERPFEPGRDNVRLVFNFGPNPSVPKETKIYLPLTSSEHRYDDDRVHNWEANIQRMDDMSMDVEVYIPPDAPVGVWRCWVETCPEGFSYYYRDGSQYHSSSYRRSRKDCSPWRSGPSAYRGEEGSPDRWDWAPFYRDDSLYRRDGSRSRYNNRHGGRNSFYRSSSPYYRNSSPYYRSSSPYYRSSRPYYRSSIPYFRNNSPYYRSSSPYYRSSNPYFRSSSPFYRSSNPYYRSSSPNYRRSSPYYRSSSPYYRSSRPYYRSSSPYFRNNSPYYRSSSPYYRSSNPYYRSSSLFYRSSNPYYRSSSPNYRRSSPYLRNNSSYYRSSSPYCRNNSPYRQDYRFNRDGSYNRQSYGRDGSFDRRKYRDGSSDRWDWAPFYRSNSPYGRNSNQYIRGYRFNRDGNYNRQGYRSYSLDRCGTRDGSFDRRNYRDGSFDRRNYRDGSFDRRNYRDGSFDRRNYRDDSFDRRNYRDGSFDRRNYRDGSFDRWDWAPFYRSYSPYSRNSSQYRLDYRFSRDRSYNRQGYRGRSLNIYNNYGNSRDRYGQYRSGSYDRNGSCDRYNSRNGSFDQRSCRDGRGNRYNRRGSSCDQFGRLDGSYDRRNRRGGSLNRFNQRRSSSCNQLGYRNNSCDSWDWAPYYRYGNCDNGSSYGDRDGYYGNDYYRNISYRDNYYYDDDYYNGNGYGRVDRYRRDGYPRNNYYRDGYSYDDYYNGNCYGRSDEYWRYRRDGYFYDGNNYYNDYPYDFNGEVFKCKQDVYILFNPWCRDDPTYMDDEMWRQEYVLNDTGKIWVGSYMQNRGRRWVYGQFDDVVLPAVMYLLEEARMSGSDRANPIRVVRAISEMVNNKDCNQHYNDRRQNDQQGDCLMMGRWDGRYDDGVSPYSWTGSVRIMEQYLRTGKPVKYGQCWVYAGVATTICRALGIPCRPVTNFTSAHDTNNTMSVDKYFSVNGDEIERGPDGDSYDSVWSFHCWNEVWMDRPDLPSGFGGWQAIDCTYQEESDGKTKCGPASLECIRSGEIGFNYDTKHLFTEINAEVNHWQQDEYADHGFNRMRPGRYCVGREIMTKRPDYDDDEYDDDGMDVIYEYKPRDWHNDHDRIMNAFRGMEHGNRTKKYDRYFMDNEDVLFEMEEMPRVYMGQPFMVQMHMMNRSNEPRSIEAMLSCHSMYYNGVKNRRIQQDKAYFELPPNQDETFTLRIMPEDYEEQMVDFCMMKMYAMANVKETRQAWGEEEDFYFQKPRIHIQTSGPQQVDQDFEVNFGFTNPLNVTLTNCRFNFEGPGLQRPRTVKYRDVRPGEMISHIERFVPKQPGETKIVSTFTSHQLNDVFGSRTIGIRE